MRRGEFYRWAPLGSPAGGWYVLVLSDDDYHLGRRPICVRIARTGAPSLYVVPLADADPIAGLIALNTLTPLPPDELIGPEGMITGATLELAHIGLRAMLGL